YGRGEEEFPKNRRPVFRPVQGIAWENEQPALKPAPNVGAVGPATGGARRNPPKTVGRPLGRCRL
ncbi:MAG TPA: hypothetical protein DD811_05310, partial [Syntrophomonas sp.]|nr:hypothetical protein [Syntrophomonas sp.]